LVFIDVLVFIEFLMVSRRVCAPAESTPPKIQQRDGVGIPSNRISRRAALFSSMAAGLKAFAAGEVLARSSFHLSAAPFATRDASSIRTGARTSGFWI
jgi:hypothetical protein